MGVWVAGLAAGVPRGMGVWVAVAGAEEPAPFGTGAGAKLVSSEGTGRSELDIFKFGQNWTNSLNTVQMCLILLTQPPNSGQI